MSNQTPPENEADEDPLSTRPVLPQQTPSGTTVKKPAEEPGVENIDPLATLAAPKEPDQTQSLGQGTIHHVASTSLDRELPKSHRFQILRPHAQGGLGEVWIALDHELKREVAVKEIKSTYVEDPVAQSRFVREAEITGKLEHPGVVPVYGFGLNAMGNPYYAMRFIEGRSLKTAIDEFHASNPASHVRSLAFRELLRRFIDVCNTLHYVHHQGVLHRDVKPHNIMVGRYGETLVVDWGLAKKQDEADHPIPSHVSVNAALSGESATMDGSALGTPQYMSPEQAAGDWENVGPKSDLYSLGATLFHLLTGVNPFANMSVSTVLAKVQSGDFQRPRQIRPSIPPALESICLKAMRLRPEERYEDCRALSADLERWLADEPVEAHGENFAERWYRRARRHRAWVMGVATVLPVLLLVMIVAALFVNAERLNAVAQRDLAIKAKDREAAQRLAAQESDRKAREQEAIARFQEEEAKRSAEEAGSTLSHLLIANGVRAQSDGDLGLAALWLQRALPVVEKYRPADIASLRVQLKQLINRLPRPTQYQPFPTEVTAWGVIPTLSPDGRSILIRGGASAIAGIDSRTGKLLWDSIPHAGLVDVCVFSPDSSHFVTTSDLHELKCFNTTTGEQVGATIKTEGKVTLHGSRTEFALDIRRDHQQIAVATTIDDQSYLEIYAVDTGKPSHPPMEFDEPILGIAIDSLRERIVIATSSELYRVDGKSGEKHSIPLRIDEIWHIQPSHDGQLLSVSSGSGYAQILDLGTLEPLAFRCEHSGPVTRTVFSPDDRYCASLSADNTVRVWDLENKKSVGNPLRHRERPWKARFSDDSLQIITVGFDHHVAVWDVQTGDLIGSPLHYQYAPEAAIVDGSALVVDSVSCSRWELSHAETPYSYVIEIPQELRGKIQGAGYSASGAIYVIGTQHGWFIEKSDEESFKPLLTTQAPIKSWHVCDDGKHVVLADSSGTLLLIEIENRKTVEVQLGQAPILVRYVPELHQVLSAMEDGSVRRIDAETGRQIEPALSHSSPITAWDVSRDGKWLAVGTQSQKIHVWDLKTMEPSREPIDLQKFGIDQMMVSLAFAKDGSAIVAGTQFGQVYLCQPFKQNSKVQKYSLDGAIQQVQFTPDDRYVLASGYTKGVRMWDWQKPEAVARTFDQDFYSLFAACDPATRLIATGGLGKVCIFDVSTSRLLAPSLQFRALGLAFHPLRSELLTLDAEIRSWDFSEENRSADDLRTLLHALTHRRLDDSGGVGYWNAVEMQGIVEDSKRRFETEFVPKQIGRGALQSKKSASKKTD